MTVNINPTTVDFGKVSINSSNLETVTISANDITQRSNIAFQPIPTPFTTTAPGVVYIMPNFPASQTLYFGADGNICTENGEYYTTSQGYGYFGTTDADGVLTVGLGGMVKLSLISPTENQELTSGTIFNIEWTSTNISTVDLEFISPEAFLALGSGVDSSVRAVAIHPITNEIYIGGYFTTAGGVSASRIAKWNGSAWSALGTGMDYAVWTLAFDSSGNLYAGGSFTTAGGVSANYIAKWNGSAWSALGSGVGATVRALAIDSSGNLYAGGDFTTAGGVSVNFVARWNGSAWSALGSGVNSSVYAITFDSSGNLYAGGDFSTAGGVTVNRIAKWNGSAWSALGSGADNTVRALAFDSSGNLYAGGVFTTAGGLSANYIAKWNGSAWSALGSGMDGTVYALAFDSSGNLYAGGYFTTAGGISASRIAKWNGSAWSALGSGMNSVVLALAFDSSGNLYAGGGFTTAGEVSADYIVKYTPELKGIIASELDASLQNYYWAVPEITGSVIVRITGDGTRTDSATVTIIENTEHLTGTIDSELSVVDSEIPYNPTFILSTLDITDEAI